MVLKKRTAILLSAALTACAQTASLAEGWDDLPSAQQPAAQPAAVQPAPAPAQPPAPTLQQLLNAMSVKYDPLHESQQAYMQRMHNLEEQVKQYEAMQEQARLDPPIKRLAPGTILPGMPAYQSDGAFSANPNDKGFFNGITAEQAAAGLKMKLENKVDHNRSPEWARQRPPVREYVDGVEQVGKEDSMGFIN